MNFIDQKLELLHTNIQFSEISKETGDFVHPLPKTLSHRTWEIPA